MSLFAAWALRQRQATLVAEARNETWAYATALGLALEGAFRDPELSDVQEIIDRISQQPKIYGVLVYGPGVRLWPGLDLRRLGLRLAVNGEVAREGKSASVIGGPLAALTWLANACASRGEGLRAGSLNTTGSCTAMLAAKAGDEAVLNVDRLGEASVRITD